MGRARTTAATTGIATVATIATTLVVACCVAAALAGCPSAEPAADAGSADGACKAGQRRCNGQTRELCSDGSWKAVEHCVSPQLCDDQLGRCADCLPGKTICKGSALHRCAADGKVGEKIKICPSGICLKDSCGDSCSRAESTRSYLGCEYWPTVTINSLLRLDFSFAVAVANPQTATAQVTVGTAAYNASPIKQVAVAPRSVATIVLPWVPELLQTADLLSPNTQRSVLVKEGAYRLRSSVPVAVYQFHPLDYILPGDCKTGPQGRNPEHMCYSETNDASLLLPAHALGKEYMVISRPTIFIRQVAPAIDLRTPGFFAVVAARPGSTKISVTFSANTQAGSGGLKSYKAGQTASFALDQWSVLQILSELPADCTPDKFWKTYGYCDLSKTTDLTGTQISADQEVAVFAGHDCALVPYHVNGGDHLEEQLLPTNTWGRRYIGAHTSSSGADPAMYRVVSAADKNTIQFSGGVHPTVTLDRGKHVELVTSKDFEVSGSGAFMLVQYMVGQRYSSTSSTVGDPSMALAVPVEQYRDSYRFLAPASYQQSHVNLIALAGAKITLDGKEVTGFVAVPSSKYAVAKLKIDGGSHTMEGTSRFGIAVYGVGSFTSYMYPGGLDLAPLTLE